MAKYSIFSADGVTKFFILLRQYKDLEIFAQTLDMWALNDRYSSKCTPNNLKLFSSPWSWILTIGTIKLGFTIYLSGILQNLVSLSLSLWTFTNMYNCTLYWICIARKRKLFSYLSETAAWAEENSLSLKRAGVEWELKKSNAHGFLASLLLFLPPYRADWRMPMLAAGVVPNTIFR